MIKSIKIMLVEDNEGDILLTTDALEESKIINKVDIARDGWEAVQMLDRKVEHKDYELPDLILLDVNLPKMNGHEVLEHIKSSETLRHIPVVMLTTSSSESDIKRAYGKHVNCYITKPVNGNSFFEIVNNISEFWLSIVTLPREN